MTTHGIDKSRCATATTPTNIRRRPMRRTFGRLAHGLVLATTALSLSLAAPRAMAYEAESAAPRAGTVRPAWMANPSNAALLYQRAWATISTAEDQFLGDAATKLEKNEAPSGEFADRLQNASGYIGMVMNASRQPAAEWGVEYEKGFAALVPHLGQLRRSARIMLADSRRLLLAGETKEGVERLATILRMSRHTGDGLLISSLVGVALTRITLEEIDAALVNQRIDAAGAAVLLNAIRPLTGEDPFQFHKALEGEAWIVVGWMSERYADKGKDAGRIFMELMGAFAGITPDSDIWKKIAALDADGLVKDLENASTYYGAIVEAWSKPDAGSRLVQIQNEIDQGKYGVLLKVLAPSFPKAHETAASITKPLADTKAKLEAIAK